MRWPTATATRETAAARVYARHRPRLAILGSPGLAYLRGLICAASIRQGFDVDLFLASCVDYSHMLADRSSDLSRFLPEVVLLAVGAECRVPQRSGAPSALTRWARQQLGAVLIRRAILPVLGSFCCSHGTRPNASFLSLLEAIERQLDDLRVGERVELSVIRKALPELLIECHLPVMWRRREPRLPQALLDCYPVARAVAAFFGIDYVCVVVDVNNHPWMVHRDIASFLLLWNKAQSSGKQSGAPRRGPDAFLFVDYNPVVTARQRASLSTAALYWESGRVCKD